MKRLAIILLFCLSATAQTDDLVAQYAKLAQRSKLQLKVLGEFSYMELELKQLDDERVNRIMHKHLLAIGEYVKQMKALDGEK